MTVALARRPRRSRVAPPSAQVSKKPAPVRGGFVADIEPNGNVRALVISNVAIAPRGRSLASARGYHRDDLMVVADIAYHYMMNGAHVLAKTLFEGLRSIDPAEPYFALALGLANDRMGDYAEAKENYVVAAKLDPRDGRPLVNLAELAFLDGDRPRAKQLLARGLERAEAAGDHDVARKADALLSGT